MDTVFAELKTAKELVADTDADWFNIKPLGGKWTKIHAGVAYDYYHATPNAVAASDFCDACGIDYPVRFSTNLYGQERSITMARYWCAKMTYYLFNLHGRRWKRKQLFRRVGS